jgi:hypothetical protein
MSEMNHNAIITSHTITSGPNRVPNEKKIKFAASNKAVGFDKIAIQ